MKPTTLFLVSVILFLFTSPSLSTSIPTVDDDIVLDGIGNPLLKDVGYIISPLVSGPIGGTVKLATPLNNQTCEADVVQDPFELYIGTPFTFTPVNRSEEFVKLGSPLAIQSPTENPCGKSTVWQVSSREGVVAQIITTGGIVNTGPSCFRISKPQQQLLGYDYIIEHCPYLCGGAKICRQVGVFRSSSSVRHLSTNGVPFQSVFNKDCESAPKQDDLLVSF
ncbi:Kunitz trypsin inhibitor 2 [Tanacetum coccineum]